jgi:glycosyltransferase involved in cell wall biosynthesis
MTYRSITQSNEPEFSILTPILNGAQYLPDCINSVNLQNISHEHILKDSNSTDSTKEVFEKLKDSGNAEFAYLTSLKDNGLSEGLNQALMMSKGKYIGWLNSDEFYMPGVLQDVQRIFEDSDADVVFGDCVFVDRRGKYVRLKPAHDFSQKVLRDYGCFISSCSTFIRRSSLSDFSFDVNLKRAMDWDLWLHLSDSKRFHYTPKIFGAFRIHPDQITATPESQAVLEFKYLQEKHSLGQNPLSVQPFSHGSLLHLFLKLKSGSYARQMKSRLQYRGQSLSWWENPDS